MENLKIGDIVKVVNDKSKHFGRFGILRLFDSGYVIIHFSFEENNVVTPKYFIDKFENDIMSMDFETGEILFEQSAKPTERKIIGEITPEKLNRAFGEIPKVNIKGLDELITQTEREVIGEMTEEEIAIAIKKVEDNYKEYENEPKYYIQSTDISKKGYLKFFKKPGSGLTTKIKKAVKYSKEGCMKYGEFDSKFWPCEYIDAFIGIGKIEPIVLSESFLATFNEIKK